VTDNNTVEDVRKWFAEESRVSDWLTVHQELIDRFSEATLDPDWMHVDPERAKRESPFGGTVAFGFWTMSLLSYFFRKTLGRQYPEGALYGLNYGFDRVRLMAPVRVGKRIRSHTTLIDIEDRGEGRYVVKTENRIEIEGEEKPAMVAEWLFMLVYPTVDES
jgi:acyl dehydratase